MTTTARDARHVPLSGVDRLRQDAAQAAQVRAWQTHPDVVALRVERVRRQVDVMLWVGIVLGLLFTMTNVQAFAASGARAWSVAWCAAWLLDPMVSLVLLAILRAEQVTARYQVPMNAWATRTKWLTFTATYVMNTWQSYGLAEQPFSLAGVILHSVPPLVVFFAAETGPGLRDRLTEAVHVAHTNAAARHAAMRPDGVHEPADGAAGGPFVNPTTGTTPVVHESAGRPVRERRTRRRTAPGSAAGKGRTSFADYLDAARAALVPGQPITPKWCRQVTGCSAGTSVKLAAALTTDSASTPTTHPITSTPPDESGEAFASREEAA